MLRKIVHIDEEACTGCGLCVSACHEGAIALIDGKAKLIRDDYCDGLGDCLPACPADAIQIIEREALAYDEKAVEENKKKAEATKEVAPLPCGCSGTMAKSFRRTPAQAPTQRNSASATSCSQSTQHAQPAESVVQSQLSQWPVQIQLVSPLAPYFQNSHILVAADCTAYAYGDFHNRFIKGHTTLIGCPKLDTVDYTEKLTAIFQSNNILSVTLTRMEVPCCGGLERAIKTAISNSGKHIPLEVVVISAEGAIVRTEKV